MRRMAGFCLVLLMTTCLAVPAFAGKAADDKATMDRAMAKFDSGEVTAEQALVEALKQNVPFGLIVAACESRLIPLSNLIAAAASIGMSSEVALARMAEAGVSKEQMSAAMAQVSESKDPGLGYTPQPAGRVVSVQPVTSNPGGSAQGGTVSPSSL